VKTVLSHRAYHSSAFSNPFGRPRLNNMNRNLRQFLKKLKPYKRGMGWHTFRHTYASHLAMKRVPMRSIVELLGHKDPRTTEIYSHLSQSHLAEMLERLDFGIEKIVEIKKEQN
jgi:site-specific recombinase XerD